MKKAMLSSVLLAALCLPAFAGNQGGNSQGWAGSYRGVPGPVVGAGLPIIAAGYGVYWLIRRRRRTLQK